MDYLTASGKGRDARIFKSKFNDTYPYRICTQTQTQNTGPQNFFILSAGTPAAWSDAIELFSKSVVPHTR